MAPVRPAYRSLSPTEARVVLGLESEGRTEVDLDGIVSRASVSRAFARRLAHTLLRKGWLQRVGRGRYLLAPARHGPDSVPDTDPLRLGRRLAQPYYFGYATAAELLGLLPQASRTYFIVSPVRTRIKLAHAAQFRFVRAPPSRMFGLRQLARRGERLVVSDRERTILDCLDRPEFAGGLGGVTRMLESAGRDLDWPRLGRYASRMGSRSIALRLGYLADQLGASPPPKAWRLRWASGSKGSDVPLGPAKEYGRRGRHDPRWHVIQNVPSSVLFSEVDVR